MTIEPINKSRLAKLAIHLLDHTYDDLPKRIHSNGSTLEFSMVLLSARDTWCSLEPRETKGCGTGCCLLGYAGHVFPEAANYDSWEKFGRWIAGDLGMPNFRDWSEGIAWKVLFSPLWPDDPVLAAARVLWVLQEERLPEPQEDRPKASFLREYVQAEKYGREAPHLSKATEEVIASAKEGRNTLISRLYEFVIEEEP